MIRSLFIFFVVILISGCTASRLQQVQLPVLTPTTLTPAQTKAVQAGLIKLMKDPDSTRFGEMIAGKNPSGEITVCGFVNGKNSYGGYTGENAFNGVIYNSGGKMDFVLAGIASTNNEQRAILEVCRRYGLTF